MNRPVFVIAVAALLALTASLAALTAHLYERKSQLDLQARQTMTRKNVLEAFDPHEACTGDMVKNTQVAVTRLTSKISKRSAQLAEFTRFDNLDDNLSCASFEVQILRELQADVDRKAAVAAEAMNPATHPGWSNTGTACVALTLILRTESLLDQGRLVNKCPASHPVVSR